MPRRTRRDPRRRRPARGPASPPSCSCRACRRRRSSVWPDGRIGDHLLPGLDRDPEPRARRRSSALSGSMAVRAFETARRSGPRARRRHARGRAPTRSGSRPPRPPSVYGDGPPGSQPVTIAPRARPGAPRRWPRRRRPRRRGCARRRGSSAGDPGARRPARRPIEPASLPHSFEGQLERRGGAVELVRRTVAGPQVTPDVRPVGVRDADVGQADGLRIGSAIRARRCRSPTPPGPRPIRARAPSAMAIATCAETAPWAARTSGGHAGQVPLHVVRVGDHAAEVVRAGPRDRGDRVPDEAARARLDRGDVQSPCQRRRPGAAPARPVSRSSATAAPYRRWVFSGGAGGANSHVSGCRTCRGRRAMCR